MNLDQLTYFLEAARHCHLAKAADILGISTGAVSHSLRALEKELGRKLFAKKGRNIVLTDHGRLLMERTKTLLAEVESVKEEVASEKAEWQGHYKLAATHLLCSKLLVPAWTKIQVENPKLTVEVFTLRSAQVVSGVAAGEYDFGLCLNPQPHPILSSRCVYDGQLVLVVRKNHPLLKDPISGRIKKLFQYPATLPKAFQGIDNCESHPAFKKFGIVPKIRFIHDSYEVAAEHIANSLTWGLFPDWIAGLYKDRLASFAPNGWEAPLHIASLWSKNRFVTKVLKQLIFNLDYLFKSRAACKRIEILDLGFALK